MPRVRGPTAGRGTDEIVEEVADHLRPWKGRQSQEAVVIEVSKQLELLRGIIPLQVKIMDRRRMRTHARELDKALSQVEEILITDPGGLNWHLFSPLPLSTDEMGSEGTMLLAFQRRAAPFYDELIRLRQVCARAINPGFGLHPNYDQTKSNCAWIAHGLMLQLSNAKITGTKDASFRAISGLLYEAVSGVPNADLKRACDEVLRTTDPSPRFLGAKRSRKFNRARTNKNGQIG
jgi:hypothetical protein